MNDNYIRPFPKVIRIEPAGACNLTCSHCPTGTIKMTRGVMKSETFALLLESIRTNLDVVKVVVLYHGGEPLLHKGFVEMVKQIKALEIPFVKTVSNGMLLDAKIIAAIVESRLDMIEFSLDGESPEENNLVRRGCDYHTVVRNVKALIDYKRAHLSATPDISISSTQFLTPDTYSKDQEPSPPDYLVREFSGEYANQIVDFKGAWAMQWPHMEVLEDIYDVFSDPYDDKKVNYCDHVENTLTVRWNGDVVSCCYDLTSRFVLGNVHQESLETIWNNKRYLGLRQSIDTRKFIPLCASCNIVRPNVFLTLKPEMRANVKPTTPVEAV